MAVKSPHCSGPAVHVKCGYNILLVGSQILAEDVVTIAQPPASNCPFGNRFGHGADNAVNDLVSHAHR